ncbi:MAG: PhzF family phenazine biosynthesis protein [Planctomycetota bacterium]
MAVPIFTVDAFAERPFSGNPAAVCLLPGPADATWMQDVAREMNLSETAFLHGEGDEYRLRWFTPAVEVELCGHATLASAHVLYETGTLEPQRRALFRTLGGGLTASREGESIALDFPALRVDPADPPPGLLEALGAEAAFVGRSRFDLLVEVSSEAQVRSLAPDFRALRAVKARGVVVTARGREFDFVSRFFAPSCGVDEDPVTGSAHCALAPFWAERLQKRELVGFQASRRGGIVRTRLEGDRVILGGRAVTVLRGQLF